MKDQKELRQDAAPIQLPQPSGVGAVIITFNPDSDLPSRIDKLLEQVSRVAIIDNGSSSASLAPIDRYQGESRLTVHRNGENLGIAAALNQGIEQLAEEGFQWVLTLDQDSSVTPGFVSELCGQLVSDPAPDKVAIVGANRRDPVAPELVHRWLRPKRNPPFFEKVPWQKLGTEGATIAITSGSLTNVAIFNELGGFRAEMFIDMVDMEYCLRARRHGYRTIIAGKAELLHRVGETKTVSILGLSISPTHHVPVRRYYLFRNSMAVMKSHGWAIPHWLVYHLIAMVHIVVGILLVEPRKLAQLRACLLGAWDGIIGRSGPARQRL